VQEESESKLSAAASVTVNVPQRMETSLECGGGVVVSGKLEGTSDMFAAGDIVLKGTLRGAYIDLVSRQGWVRAERVLEGVSRVEGALGVSCAKVLGERCSLRGGEGGGGVHVGAIYCGDLAIESCAGGDVDVGSLHGSARVVCNGGGVVKLRGVTGQVLVEGSPAGVDIQFDSVRGESKIMGCTGDVSVVLCPPVLVRLDLNGGGTLDVDAGIGGTFNRDTGELVCYGGSEGMVGGEVGGGGSGKIREGVEISGWWERGWSSGGAPQSPPSPTTITVHSFGKIRVSVLNYEQFLTLGEAGQQKSHREVKPKLV